MNEFIMQCVEVWDNTPIDERFVLVLLSLGIACCVFPPFAKNSNSDDSDSQQ